jgi:hypothetical protein
MPWPESSFILDQDAVNLYNYNSKQKEWRDADARMAFYYPSSWWFFSRFGD